MTIEECLEEILTEISLVMPGIVRQWLHGYHSLAKSLNEWIALMFHVIPRSIEQSKEYNVFWANLADPQTRLLHAIFHTETPVDLSLLLAEESSLPEHGEELW